MPASPIHAYRPESHMWPSPANSYVLEDSGGAVLIDAGCGFRECYERLRAFLRGLGYAPSDVHTLLLSHAHPDHMGAVPFLLEESSPRIFIHELEKPLASDNSLLNRTFDMAHITTYWLERLGDTDPASIDIISYFAGLCPMGSAEASDTLVEGDVLALGGRRLEVLHTPGHAPGHVSFFDRENSVLIGGDIIGAVVAWYCPSGGGARGYLESLRKVEALEPDLVLPSHGPEICDVQAAIEKTRSYILARDDAVLETLAGGERSLLELTDALFPNEGMRMFPGLQITDSHLIKLEEDGLVMREEREGMPYFTRVL